MAQTTISADAVANTFVKRYTEVLGQDPSLLARFFHEESTFLHGVEGDDTVPDRGVEAITKRLGAIDFSDSTFLVLQVDGQASVNGSVLVNVLGTLRHGSDSRPFVQTFVLAPQEPNGFFVLNYVFRSFREHPESDGKHEGKRGKGKGKGPKAEPAAQAPPSDAAVPAPAALPASVAAPPPAAAAPVASPSNDQAPPPPAAAAASSSPSNSPATAVAAPGGGKSSTFSYRAALSAPGKPAAAAAAAAAAPAPSAAAPRPAASSKPPREAAAAAKPAAAASSSSGKRAAVDNPSALCVKNVPFNTTEEQLITELSKHAKVKFLSMKKGFAFLDLDTEEAVQRLVELSLTNPIVIDGRTLNIERRSGEGPVRGAGGSGGRGRGGRGGRGAK